MSIELMKYYPDWRCKRKDVHYYSSWHDPSETQRGRRSPAYRFVQELLGCVAYVPVHVRH